MGVQGVAYDAEHDAASRHIVPLSEEKSALTNIRVEVELGFDQALAEKEAQRCLNCDVQTVFTENLCIECDACVDICPMDCISFVANEDEAQLRQQLTAPADNATAVVASSSFLITFSRLVIFTVLNDRRADAKKEAILHAFLASYG